MTLDYSLFANSEYGAMAMKPQDVVVALKLLSEGERPRPYAVLAAELGMSASEIHGAVARLREGGLVALEGRLHWEGCSNRVLVRCRSGLTRMGVLGDPALRRFTSRSQMRRWRIRIFMIILRWWILSGLGGRESAKRRLNLSINAF